MYKNWLIVILGLLISCKGTDSSSVVTASFESDSKKHQIIVSSGAEQLPLYVPKLKDKRVGVVINHASVVGSKHLLDTLLQLQVNVEKIFVPEHGFRGKADAGAQIDDSVDGKTGLPIISLYGKQKKPKPVHLEGLDILVFDLQDVGVRCYTYLSTLHYVMEACAENQVELVVLDRPNPNIHYVDGPVLDQQFQSFVGLHPVPLVYGMTIGEYAKMIQGEKWIQNADRLTMGIVPCSAYSRDTRYVLPKAPSPNLKSIKSILLYPSLVFFEGTVVSAGRGTETPFEIFGHPKWSVLSYAFTPTSREGAKSPKWENQVCLGFNLGAQDEYQVRKQKYIQLKPLMDGYGLHNSMGVEGSYFLENRFIDKLAGTDKLRKQIIDGLTEDEIRDSWQSDLAAFQEIRTKYLIYPETRSSN